MVRNQMRIEIGDFIELAKGETSVRGQCMGFKVDKEGMAKELWIDGFYTAFELGETEYEWRLIDGEI